MTSKKKRQNSATSQLSSRWIPLQPSSYPRLNLTPALGASEQHPPAARVVGDALQVDAHNLQRAGKALDWVGGWRSRPGRPGWPGWHALVLPLCRRRRPALATVEQPVTGRPVAAFGGCQSIIILIWVGQLHCRVGDSVSVLLGSSSTSASACMAAGTETSASGAPLPPGATVSASANCTNASKAAPRLAPAATRAHAVATEPQLENRQQCLQMPVLQPQGCQRSRWLLCCNAISCLQLDACGRWLQTGRSSADLFRDRLLILNPARAGWQWS